MKWINSTGGPLIIIERKNSSLWGGATEKDGLHYEYSCKTSEYAQQLVIENFKVVVLGDEPLQTAAFEKGKDGILIVRWRYAENEAEVLKAVSSFNGENLIGRFTISWETTELVLFDAADIFEPGTDFLEFHLLWKDCILETFEFNPSPTLALLIHKISY